MDKEARELFRGFLKSVYGDDAANNDEFVQAQIDGLRREYQKEKVSVADIRKLIRTEFSADKFARVFKKLYPDMYTEVFFRPAPSRFGDHTRLVSQAEVPFPKGKLSANDCVSMFGSMPGNSMLGLYKQTDGLLRIWIQYDGVLETSEELDWKFEQMLNMGLSQAKSLARKRAMDFWEKNDPMSGNAKVPDNIYQFLKGISMSYLGELGTHGEIEDDIKPDFAVEVYNDMIRYDIITSPLYGFSIKGDDVPFITEHTPPEFEVSLSPTRGADLGFAISVCVPVK